MLKYINVVTRKNQTKQKQLLNGLSVKGGACKC